jgi:RND family efflux transporter MFP subunit
MIMKQSSTNKRSLKAFEIPCRAFKKAMRRRRDAAPVVPALHGVFPRARIGDGLAAAALAVTSLALSGCAQTSPAALATPTVSCVTVEQRDVPIIGDWVATLEGFTSAQIQPQVTGYLIKQNYREGSVVHKDDVLFEIDPRPFQAALDQAKGQLAQASAQLGLATINLNRDTPVAKLHAIPQSQLDNDIQNKLAAEAVVQAAEAAVEQAQLNLEFTKVRSLIDGIAGIAQTQIGNLVATSTVLTTVSKVDPIKVYFPISEQEYLRIGAKISGTVDLFSDKNRVPLELILADGTTYPHAGGIIFADREVNPQTGTIRIVGAFPNPGNLLRPGQFGRVRAVTAYRKDALLIPQRAVTERQGKYQVATVGPDDKVSIRTVTVADRVGQLWVITDGLKLGDRVVTEGVQKVAEGARVNPVADHAADGSR